MAMFNHIHYVYTAYEEKSFTKAAQRLYVSQPALSGAIKKLENELGYPIFDRGGKEITPTELGMKYIKAVEEILVIQKNLECEVDDLINLRKGSILLGGTTFIVSNLLPEVLKKFGEKFPEIEVQILVEQSTVLREKLESGLLDLAIDNALTYDPDYEYIPLFKERILIGVPKGNEVNDHYREYQIHSEVIKSGCDYDALPKLPIEALKDEKFILLKSGNKMRQMSHNIFAESHISPKICFEFDQLMTSISFAKSGLGACFLTDTIIKHVEPCEEIGLYQPDTKFCDRELYLMYKKNKYLSAACRELMEFMKGRY
jgi:DNA-binding transcriptional LysR family regulator